MLNTRTHSGYWWAWTLPPTSDASLHLPYSPVLSLSLHPSSFCLRESGELGDWNCVCMAQCSLLCTSGGWPWFSAATAGWITCWLVWPSNLGSTQILVLHLPALCFTSPLVHLQDKGEMFLFIGLLKTPQLSEKYLDPKCGHPLHKIPSCYICLLRAPCYKLEDT